MSQENMVAGGKDVIVETGRSRVFVGTTLTTAQETRSPKVSGYIQFFLV